MLRVSISISALLTGLGILVFTAGHDYTSRLQAAETSAVAFLVRFGEDGVKDVDWSGSVSPTPRRLLGWQFDANDTAHRDRWKCATRQERYWDTPYERSMKGTSNKDKVTGKGVLVEFDSTPGSVVRFATTQGDFSFETAPSLWTAPRKFLDGRVEVRAVPAGPLLPSAADLTPPSTSSASTARPSSRRSARAALLPPLIT